MAAITTVVIAAITTVVMAVITTLVMAANNDCSNDRNYYSYYMTITTVVTM